MFACEVEMDTVLKMKVPSMDDSWREKLVQELHDILQGTASTHTNW